MAKVMIKTFFFGVFLGFFSVGVLIWAVREEKSRYPIVFSDITTALQEIEGLLKKGPSGWKYLAGWCLEPGPDPSEVSVYDGPLTPEQKRDVRFHMNKFKFEYFSMELKKGISLLCFEKATIDRNGVVFSYLSTSSQRKSSKKTFSNIRYYSVGWIFFRKCEKGWVLQNLFPTR